MKLVSYLEKATAQDLPPIRLGALAGECVIDLHVAQSWAQGARGFPAREIPSTMLGLLRLWPDLFPHLQALMATLEGEDCLQLKGARRQPVAHPRSEVYLLPPLPNVLSLRLFPCFEQHVRNVHRMRGQPFPKAWPTTPIFYYANPFTVMGPDQALTIPQQGSALDYELGVVCFIGKQGQDIPPEQAEEHIAGYSILSDWVLRDVEQQELSLGWGPAKSRDFATTLGPALVTPDELADRRAGTGAEGRYDLAASAAVNGEEKGRINLKDMHWSFAQLIAHASRDVMLYPGEAIGVIMGGSLLEVGAGDSSAWLKPGDRVALEAERLGRLETTILGREAAAGS